MVVPCSLRQGPGVQGSEVTVLGSPCALSEEQKKEFVFLVCFVLGGEGSR